MKQNRFNQRVKFLLKIYSVGVFVFIMSIPVLLFVAGKLNVESAAGDPCSGGPRSGAECTGYPGDGMTWGCYDNGSGYRCYAENYSSCRFLDYDGNWYDCGCNAGYNRCVTNCQNQFAGQPGIHYWSDRCDNCGQIVGCSCNISGPTPTPTQPPTPTPTNPPGCPYNEAVVRFQNNTSVPWATNISLTCGESFRVGALNTATGSELGSDAELYINGQLQSGRIVTVNSQAPGPQTFNAEVRVKNPSGGYYSEANCNDSLSITCTPPNEEDECPYNRVAIQFSLNGSNWQNSVSLNCGSALYARVINTATGQVIGSNGRFFLNNTRLPSNQYSFTTSTPGPNTYNFRADVLNKSGVPYTESNCLAYKSVTCTQQVDRQCNSECTDTNQCPNNYQCYHNRCRDTRWLEEPDCKMEYDITKEVISGNNGLLMSEVTFRVTLLNNSDNTTFDSVPYVDNFNPSQLIFRNPVTGYSPSHPEGVTFNLNANQGVLSHPNLASVLGPLGPKQSYTLIIRFQATASGSGICNEAGWNPEDYGWKYDDACLGIQVPPPDTDL